jgi:predicted extracellular nuclease
MQDSSGPADDGTVDARDTYNALINDLPVAARYTYLCDGNSQILDHILVTEDLANVLPEVDVVHMNAEFLGSLRPTDYDPVVARFRLPWRMILPLIFKGG